MHSAAPLNNCIIAKDSRTHIISSRQQEIDFKVGEKSHPRYIHSIGVDTPQIILTLLCTTLFVRLQSCEAATEFKTEGGYYLLR